MAEPIKLRDYLGHLLAEITRAKAASDGESVRVAEYYSTHRYLRNMPVPRFNIPEITLDIPFAVDSVETASDAVSPAELDYEPHKSNIEYALKESGIKLNATQLKELHQVGKQALADAPASLKAAKGVSDHTKADRFTDDVVEKLATYLTYEQWVAQQQAAKQLAAKKVAAKPVAKKKTTAKKRGSKKTPPKASAPAPIKAPAPKTPAAKKKTGIPTRVRKNRRR